MNITVGADPEFFVRKGLHYLSGHVFDCGTKRQPRRTEHGYVQVDGIALECNVRPSTTSEDFLSNLRGVMGDLYSIVSSREPSASLVAKPTIFFGHTRLGTIPPENAELGCTPDFNAYTGKRNPTPDRDLPIRTGSGHIHIGWTEDENPQEFKYLRQCGKITRQLDYFLGLPSLLWDGDNKRRRLYGMAGAFRPKSYGLEYRVLSNAWCNSDRLVRWVFDRTVAAVKAVNEGSLMEAEFGTLAQDIINTGHTEWNREYPVLAQMVLV